jgi:hypothetical protein
MKSIAAVLVKTAVRLRGSVSTGLRRHAPALCCAGGSTIFRTFGLVP